MYLLFWHKNLCYGRERVNEANIASNDDFMFEPENVVFLLFFIRFLKRSEKEERLGNVFVLCPHQCLKEWPSIFERFPFKKLPLFFWPNQSSNFPDIAN